jgi:hypothetical protein
VKKREGGREGGRKKGRKGDRNDDGTEKLEAWESNKGKGLKEI